MSEIEIVGGLIDQYVQVPNDIFRTPGIKSRAVHVYGNLRSNRSGWETNTRRVAEVTGLSHNTVMAAINDLIDLGYVERIEIPGEGGQFSSYKYRVFDHRKQILGAVPDLKIESGNLTQKLSQAPDAKIESYKKNSFKKTKEEDQPPISPKGDETRFDEFWNVYDKKVAVSVARKKYKQALKKVDEDTLIEAARKYVQSQKAIGKHPQFTANPATWLNQERWSDEVVDSSPAVTFEEKGWDFDWNE